MRLTWLSLCLFTLVAPAPAADWSSWRGPMQNGVSTEKDLPDTFEVENPGKDNLIWKAPYGCRSTPLILNGRVYFNNSVGKDVSNQERVVCLDEKTGKLIWEYKFNVFHTGIVSARVGWTNLAADPATGNIYCHGTQGMFLCFDKDGKVLWSHSLGEEFGRVSGYGGRLASPIVDGDLVILGMACAAWGEYGRGGCRFVAFDKKTGQIAWWGSTALHVLDTFQSSPVVAVIKGERLLISGGADGGIHAFKVRTGEKVWSYVFADGAINPSPVVDGTRVYIAHGEVNNDAVEQGRILCLDAGQVKDGKPKKVWQIDGPKIKFATPILHEGRLYLNDENATLYCLAAEDGKQHWKMKYGRGGNVRCSPVLADGKIYVGDANSTFHILEPGKTRCKRLHKVELEGDLDGAAAVANGRVFFATNDTIFCLGKPDSQPAPAVTVPELEPAGTSDTKPAHLQVFPADVTLSPGDSASFKARLFDERGQFLREVKAEWSLGAMLPPEVVPGLPVVPPMTPPLLKGTLTSDGKLTVPVNLQGQFGAVIARAEGVTGQARVRQVPKLPYKQDFENVPEKAVPGGWVNSQVKFQVRKVGESKVLVKTATNPSPLVARANAYFGPPSWSDYTIEADILGKKKGKELPDMGLVNSRYTFALYGSTQQLQLTSWDALPRIDKAIIYPWKNDVWYRMKFGASVNGGKAMIRGKIWERGKAEPEKWTVEVEDPIPNTEGSPALYAFVTGIPKGGSGAEVFFDNLVVTSNKDGKQSRVPALPKNDKKEATEQAAPVPQDSIVEEPIPYGPRFQRHRLRWWRR